MNTLAKQDVCHVFRISSVGPALGRVAGGFGGRQGILTTTSAWIAEREVCALRLEGGCVWAVWKDSIVGCLSE